MDMITINQTTPSKRNAVADSNSNSPKRPKTESKTEEDHFSQLYNDALGIITKTMNVSDDELIHGIETVIENFRYVKSNKFSDNDFNKSEILCAFFYRYSPLSTELSRFKIAEAINNCEVLRSHFRRDEMRVVSIGGGPGCDIVGFCSALSMNVECTKLDVTVVDSAKRWNSFLNIVEFLLREGDYGNASRMFKKTNASMSFICEDVCATSTSTAYLEALKNADVILMKGLLSVIYPFEAREFPAENVARIMKVGAVLLFIDCFDYDFCKFGFKMIYKSWKERGVNPSFFVQGSPVKYYGAGIAPSSKFQIAVFKKTKQVT